MVQSSWETSSGPARRVYRLNKQGDRYLAAWMADLRATAEMLHSFLDEYDRHMALQHGESQ